MLFIAPEDKNLENMKNLLFQNRGFIKMNIALVLLFAIFVGCKKQKIFTELEKLPPITQTGANTFGCLVNGIAWLPNGRKPQYGGPNPRTYVDPTFQGGRFSITASKYKIPVSTISVGSANCTSAGVFYFTNDFNGGGYSQSVLGSLACELSTSDLGTYKTGFLNLTKYDLTTGIFSGTFEFTLYSPQSLCGDTIKITDGRFDIKL